MRRNDLLHLEIRSADFRRVVCTGIERWRAAKEDGNDRIPSEKPARRVRRNQRRELYDSGKGAHIPQAHA